ncbi:MAG TPA: TetR/AcrR family transcriptional regulator [Candidatus Xenobia bacterium]|jgi:AcrR family transcriptional regulator
MKKQDAAARSRNLILDAALQVFADKGFHQATNQDIARAAGIGSAGLIYHYFQDKKDLLVKVVERASPLLRLLAMPGDFVDLPLREGLVRWAQAFLGMAESPAQVAVARVLIGEALRDPDTAARFFAVGPGRGLGFLGSFLHHHMEAGRLRPQTPDLLARQFMGPLVLALLLRVIFRRPEAMPEGLAERTVDTFLEGAAV